LASSLLYISNAYGKIARRADCPQSVLYSYVYCIIWMNKANQMAQKKNIIKRTAEAPADILGKSVAAAERLESNLPPGKVVKRGRDYWHNLGPGLTTGASDDDPSGIATYSQAGAQFGFSLLWLAPFTFPLMSVVQEMCARIGLVTGRGLAGNIRLKFSKKILYLSTILLFAANTFNLGADLGAMAKGAQLLNPNWNFATLVIGFGLLSLALQIFTPYAKYARYLKWLAMVLFAYIASAILAHLNWGDVIHHTVVPHVLQRRNTFDLCHFGHYYLALSFLLADFPRSGRENYAGQN
jgi:hypothetical protein